MHSLNCQITIRNTDLLGKRTATSSNLNNMGFVHCTLSLPQGHQQYRAVAVLVGTQYHIRFNGKCLLQILVVLCLPTSFLVFINNFPKGQLLVNTLTLFMFNAAITYLCMVLCIVQYRYMYWKVSSTYAAITRLTEED